jgi:hypothetical protein
MNHRVSLSMISIALLSLFGAGPDFLVTETRAQSACDPNYADACVPIASDVDCAGGSGNGPEYVNGPLRVVGTDIYGLDKDGDGIACDRQ